MKPLILSLHWLIIFLTATIQAQVELPNGTFNHQENEMTILANGVSIAVGWHIYGSTGVLNANWKDLQPEYGWGTPPTRQPDATAKTYSGSQPVQEMVMNLQRGRYDYPRLPGTIYFVYDERRRITETDSGYQWTDKNGDWIHYGPDFKILSFGHRHLTQGIFQRDADGRIHQVTDAQGAPYLFYEYNSEGRLIRVYDHSTPVREIRFAYNALGQTTEVTNVLGYTRYYTYYPSKKLESYTDNQGHVTTLTYHSNGKVATVLDENQRGWYYVFDYDQIKKQYYVRQAHTSGRIIEHWYDKHARLQQRDINGETIETSRSDLYRQKDTLTDRRGFVSVKTYDIYRNLLSTTYPDDSQTTQQVDPVFSQVTQRTNEAGVITRYAYNDFGYLQTLIEAVGTPQERRTEYTTDERGLFTQVKRLGDSLTATQVTHYQYDRAGHLIQVTDALGQITTYDYNGQGHLLRENQIDSQGQSISTAYQYDAKGQLRQRTQPLGETTRYTYDGNGNLLSQREYSRTQTLLSEQSFTYDSRNHLIAHTDALGTTTTYTYDERDNLTSITDANGQSETFQYDLFNHKISHIRADGEQTRWRYQQGWLTQVEYPTYTESYTYDRRGRLLTTHRQSRLPNAPSSTHQTTTNTYDPVGNRIRQLDAKNRPTEYTYDALNRLIQSTDSQGDSTQYTYDNRDNLLSVTDANGHVIRRYAYDGKNQNIRETKAEGEQETQVYNALGLLAESTHALGHVSRYTYNANQQLIRLDRYAANSSDIAQSIHFDYLPQGQLSGYQDGQTSATYTYNAQGQKTAETVHYGPFSKTHRYTYNDLGQKDSFTHPEGLTALYRYTANHHIAQIELPNIGFITYHYHQGQVEQINFPGNHNQYWRYDGLGRPESILTQDVAQAPLDSRDYQYDKANNIVEQIIREGTLAYQYNSLDRLSQVNYHAHPDLTLTYHLNTTHPPENEQYTYDPVGNRLTSHKTQETWQYNANNELLHYTQDGEPVSFQYNAQGQLTQKTLNGIQTHYTYHLDGRLQSIQNHHQQTLARYTYDPFGRRLSKTLYTYHQEGEEPSTTATTTYYAYSDEGLIAEYNETGELIQSYGYAPNSPFSTNPLYSHRPDFTDAGGYAYYINDHLGTPKKLMTHTGRIVWFGESEAFGETALVKDEFPNPLRFPGQYYDEESGLHYNFHRYYDPELGRFITSDPIGIRGGINLYSYANNHPINKFDVLGLFTDFMGGADFMGAEGNYSYKGFSGGGGISIVTCCDDMHNKMEFVFWKICVGIAGPGVGGSIIEGKVKNMQGEECSEKSYTGYFLEFNGGLGGIAGGYDVGLTPELEQSGVDEGGVGMGTPGVGVHLCYYRLISKREIGICDCDNES